MAFLGVWSTEKDDLTTCIKEIGLPACYLKIAKDIGLQLEISKHGDEYVVKHVASVVISDQTFKPGQEFETTNWLGEKVKGAVRMDGNTMVADTMEGKVKSTTTLQCRNNRLDQTRDFGNGAKPCIAYVKA